MTWWLACGDSREVLPALQDASVDSVVCDPPYELGFMGRSWDSSGIAYDVSLWREVLRVLKPGGHLLAFGGTRTYHRMTCAIEDAGFEIRDSIHWIYGTGFPKSLDVSKAIDKAAGAEREVIGNAANFGASKAEDGKSAFGDYAGKWEITAPATEAARQWAGWGTALKPAHEPIVVARKPLDGTVAANVLAHGTGAINVEACRVSTADDLNGGRYSPHGEGEADGNVYGHGIQYRTPGGYTQPSGRWPANVVLDEDAGRELDEQSGLQAARFFYCAKVSKAERGEGNTHPTVKPVSLMRWLVRLVTPPGGLVLDPFAGSGSTGVAAIREGFRFAGIELSDEYACIARARIARVEP